MNRKVSAVLVVIALSVLLLSSGCVQTAIHSRVQPDGTVSDYRVTLNTSSAVYRLLAQSATEEGYSSLREMFSDPGYYRKDGEGSDLFGGDTNFEYDEVWSGDSVRLVFKNQAPMKPDAESGLRIYRDGEYLVYRHAMNAPSQQAESEYSGMASSMFPLDYYLEMPGTIVDSNANTIQGNTAEWHTALGGPGVTEIYAKSELPPSLPGFTCIQGIAGVLGLAAAAVHARRRKE